MAQNLLNMQIVERLTAEMRGMIPCLAALELATIQVRHIQHSIEVSMQNRTEALQVAMLWNHHRSFLCH